MSEDADAPDYPTVTYTSSPEGGECAACGAVAEERWRAGEGASEPEALVCPGCKEW